MNTELARHRSPCGAMLRGGLLHGGLLRGELLRGRSPISGLLSGGLLLGAIVISSACQSAPALTDATVALSLTDAVALASAQSPDTAARAAATEAAQAVATAAGQLPDPELVLGIDNLPANGRDAGSFSNDFMTMRKIGVMQTFPRQEKRLLRTQRANDDTLLARVNERLTLLAVKRAAAEAWINTFAAEQSLTIFRTLAAQITLQAQLVNDSVKSGRASIGDALQAKSAQLALRDRAQSANQNLGRARNELARWLPQDAARPLADAPDFAKLHPAEALVDINHHAPMQAFAAQVAAARTDISLANADKAPDWSLGLSYAQRGARFSNMVSLEVRVGLPLFASTRQEPLVVARRASLVSVEAQADAARRMHAAEVADALSDWQVLNARVASLERERLPLARQEAQARSAAFQAGRGAIKDVLDAQMAQSELQLQAIDLHAQLGRTWAFLFFLQDEVVLQAEGAAP